MIYSLVYLLYPYLIDIIAVFHSLSNVGTVMSSYFSIVLIMSLLIFFNRNIACILSVSVFMANTSNSIMKSVICFFSCLNNLIFHSMFAILLLLLKSI